MQEPATSRWPATRISRRKSTYTFTVVATDAANNSAEQPVSLTIGNVNDTPVTITSSATAAAITENSGAGQVAYTAAATASTGAAITYSLKAVGDVSAFSINASSGVVTLGENPNFEAKSSYSFTVVATDAAGNFSEQTVSLAINDIVDEALPSVSAVAITSAVGAQNGVLNAGDTVNVTVTMSENTVVGGTPTIGLTIGANPVNASYVSGSGTNRSFHVHDSAGSGRHRRHQRAG